jgi:hypothetical protein
MKLRGDEAGPWVKDQRDGSGVLRGTAKITTNPRSFLPLGLGLTRLKGGVQDVHRTSAWSKMVRFGPDGNTREEFQRGLGVGPLGDGAVDFGSQAKGKGPQVVGRKRVVMASVDQHGASAIGKFLDATFSITVLMMGVDATKSHGLLSGVHRDEELLGGKLPLSQ